jgi:hypothetical protein
VLTSQLDSFVWKLNTSGKFMVKSLYLDLMDDHTPFLRKYIWKIKVPLKIRIFMWFLHQRVRNWVGSNKCCHCDKEETIQHLFIECPLARVVWRVIHISLNLPPPRNITNMFGNWLMGVDKKESAQIRVGVCALLWALWNVRNDYIF